MVKDGELSPIWKDIFSLIDHLDGLVKGLNSDYNDYDSYDHYDDDDDYSDLYIIGAVCLSVTKVIISELSA